MGKYDDLITAVSDSPAPAAKTGKYADLIAEAPDVKADDQNKLRAMYLKGTTPEIEMDKMRAGMNTVTSAAKSGAAKRTKGMRDPITGEIGPTLDEGVSDAAGTLGTAISRGADAASLGYYSKLRDAAENTIRPGMGYETHARENKIEADNPVAVGLGRGAGYFFGLPAIAARAVGTGVAAIGRVLPEVTPLIARPLAGAATGAATNAAVSAGEAGAQGASPQEMLSAAGQGAKTGAAFGAGIGAIGGAAEAAGKGAAKRLDARTVADWTDGAPAGKRDAVVGKGGQKVNRVVELAKRYGLDAAGGDSQAQLHGAQAAIDDVGGRLDQVYQGVKVPTADITKRMVGLSNQLDQNPATRGLADEVFRAAQDVHASWGTGDVDARAVRKYATSLGKSLFRGNPNVDPTLANAARRELYGALVDTVGQHVERAKPGTAETLGQLNSDMSDLLNLQSSVTSKASREASPSTRLSNVAAKVSDAVIGFTRPTHYLAKKAIGHYGPGLTRGIDSELATANPGPLLQSANPIVQAYEGWKAEGKRRSEQVQARASAAAEREQAAADAMQAQQDRIEELLRNGPIQNGDNN